MQGLRGLRFAVISFSQAPCVQVLFPFLRIRHCHVRGFVRGLDQLEERKSIGGLFTKSQHFDLDFIFVSKN